MGDRQMLPVQTNTTRKGPTALGTGSVVVTGSFCPLPRRDRDPIVALEGAALYGGPMNCGRVPAGDQRRNR